MSFAELAEAFCVTTPHRSYPFNKRNWGGTIHSLCSYQGKLKPSIAHFLVDWFTEPGQKVLDPMSGVGTIPLEARRLGRIGLANDLSPLAYSVSSAKLEPIKVDKVQHFLDQLSNRVALASSLDEKDISGDVDWGLNKNIRDYFHPLTLREIIVARNFFAEFENVKDASLNLVLASLLHILHGNRPYALSRNSHPITPLSPTGEFEYKSLMIHLRKRVDTAMNSVNELATVSFPGTAVLGDFRNMNFRDVDAIITSPPFTNSLKFWSSNWMRLWFSGWNPNDFKTEPPKFLESEQKKTYDPYRDFAAACSKALKPGGRLILHLGENAKDNMADQINPLLSPHFDIVYSGREGVSDTESHGLTDKGATSAHLYVFAIKRNI